VCCLNWMPFQRWTAPACQVRLALQASNHSNTHGSKQAWRLDFRPTWDGQMGAFWISWGGFENSGIERRELSRQFFLFTL
jgi:hypothetical protein